MRSYLICHLNAEEPNLLFLQLDPLFAHPPMQGPAVHSTLNYYLNLNEVKEIEQTKSSRAIIFTPNLKCKRRVLGRGNGKEENIVGMRENVPCRQTEKRSIKKLAG